MKFLFLIFLTFINTDLFGQFLSNDETPYVVFSTRTGGNESLKFEARPRVAFYLNSNIKDKLINNHYDAQLWEVVFDPHIRMYSETSVPVKMPSYRIFISYNYVKVMEKTKQEINFWGLKVDHGHYSNGQNGCAFGNSIDGDSSCLEVYKNLWNKNPSIELNRNSGEFSTDFYRITSKYSANMLDDDRKIKSAYELLFSYTRLSQKILYFLDFGGYEDKNKDLYPLNQVYFECAYHSYENFKLFENKYDIRVGVDYSYKPTNHKLIYPSTFGVFFNLISENELGLYLRYEYGQDTYNIRFVDKINRIMFGCSWSIRDRNPYE